MSSEVDSHFEVRGVILACVIGVILSLVPMGFPDVQAQDRAYQFGLMGDTGYTTEDIEGFKGLLAAVNGADLSFVVHVGDFENDGRAYTRNPSVGPMPCTDESFNAVYDSFQAVRHPFILTPGDNDWTDCHGVQARKFDPLERLAKLRTMFFPDGRSLGQRTMPVISQAADPQFGKFPENLRWSTGGVTFVTLHIVGSNDNFGRTPEMDAEHSERKAANIVWLRKAFSEAKANNSRGLALLTQANPNFENYWPTGQKSTYLRMIPGTRASENAEATGYDEYVKTLAEEMETYTWPTVFLHGDTHRFRVDQPLFSAKNGRRFENFTRVSRTSPVLRLLVARILTGSRLRSTQRTPRCSPSKRRSLPKTYALAAERTLLARTASASGLLSSGRDPSTIRGAATYAKRILAGRNSSRDACTAAAAQPKGCLLRALGVDRTISVKRTAERRRS